MTEFYMNIEPAIRDIVKTLRDNGVNTTCSCGHEMYVEVDVIPDGMLSVMHKALYNYLAENKQEISYTITITLEQNIAGLSRCYAHVDLATKPDTGR